MMLEIYLKIMKRLNRIYAVAMSHRFRKCGSHFSLVFPSYFYGEKYIEVGDYVHLDRHTKIEAWDRYMNRKYRPNISIGNHVSMNSDCHIGACGKIVIEDSVLIGTGVTIIDHFHGEINAEALRRSPLKRNLYTKRPVVIHKNVWIGEHAVILPGVTVGENAIIGANAVVTKDVPANAVVGGSPARVIKIVDLPE